MRFLNSRLRFASRSVLKHRDGKALLGQTGVLVFRGGYGIGITGEVRVIPVDLIFVS